MRLDPDLKWQILEKVSIYSGRLSIAEPRVLLTTRDVLEMPRQMTRGRRSTAYRYYGVAYLKSSMIFINIRKIPNEQVLDETIVHELIHMRFPYLSHGRRFNGLIRRARRGGVFLPYRKRR